MTTLRPAPPVVSGGWICRSRPEARCSPSTRNNSSAGRKTTIRFDCTCRGAGSAGKPCLLCPCLSTSALTPAAQATRFSIRVQGLNGVVPVAVRFPRIGAIAPQESEVLAVPYWMGEKTTQARQLLSPAPGKAERREFSYPGILSMQCMAFYRENGPGLYLAADDIEARSKSFAAFGDGQGGLGLEVCHVPGRGYGSGRGVRTGVRCADRPVSGRLDDGGGAVSRRGRCSNPGHGKAV